jgi:acyl dehydratase
MSVYFDDLAEDMTYTSQGRTLTEADIMTFAGLSGDFNPLHTDETWVREHTDFNGRIAHGLLVLSISSGLRTPGLDDWSILAYLGVERRMAGPAYPGDTLVQKSTVTSLRRSKSQPDAGIVVVAAEVTNQNGVPIQYGTDTYLVAAKSGDKR